MAQRKPQPRGRREYMRRSYHLTVNQVMMQRNWSLYRKRRHREYSEIPPHGAHPVEWTDQVTVRCGECYRRLGSVVAFHSDDRYGIVEDTARWTLEHVNPPIFTGKGDKHPPWLWIEGDGRSAVARFRCPRCHESRPRNAHRLGQQIVQEQLGEIVISR